MAVAGTIAPPYNPAYYGFYTSARYRTNRVPKYNAESVRHVNLTRNFRICDQAHEEVVNCLYLNVIKPFYLYLRNPQSTYV